ncbi:MAG: tagaturonate epimerase family protein [Bryobacteraceae bacterium]
MILEKYSLGVGDRFAHQAKAQLAACMFAAERGVSIIPVWNKSNREHKIVGSEPSSTRVAADAAVRESGWTRAYYVDADHINLDTVDRFLESSDFFTIDVADAIGRRVDPAETEVFLRRHPELESTDALAAASKYLAAVSEAGWIYRRIAERKTPGTFVTEVSMDETDSPQTPAELLLILAAIADEGIPIQTIAPKFTGRFNKGVDYVGNVEQFESEFSADLGVIAQAIQHYNLPGNLKLSVHSGSDKFSLYGPMRRALRRCDAGVHLKTAGTTWLEELIGLAEADPEGLAMAKEIYAGAYEHLEDLRAPYAAVIDIDPVRLPAPAEVLRWTAEQYTGALRHDPANLDFNPHLRQLLHVAYKIAAGMGERYTDLLQACEGSIARNVTANLFARHIEPLFLRA